jgi:hypothetical protein
MFFALLGLVSTPFFTRTYATNVETDVKPLLNNYKAIGNSKEELYKDIFITLLEPYSEKAIADYYSKYLNSPHKKTHVLLTIRGEISKVYKSRVGENLTFILFQFLPVF